MILDGQRIKCTIFDTAGEERFISLSRHYFKWTDGIILAYDVNNRKSFEYIIA